VKFDCRRRLFEVSLNEMITRPVPLELVPDTGVRFASHWMTVPDETCTSARRLRTDRKRPIFCAKAKALFGGKTKVIT
jgi:hypothetical protein